MEGAPSGGFCARAAAQKTLAQIRSAAGALVAPAILRSLGFFMFSAAPPLLCREVRNQNTLYSWRSTGRWLAGRGLVRNGPKGDTRARARVRCDQRFALLRTHWGIGHLDWEPLKCKA